MKYKQIVISLLIGLTLGLSTNAFAAVGDTVSAVFANFNYVVNGEAKTLDAPVLVYEGTSYVRTTQIGNLLNFDVTYKKDSRTIEFNNPDSVQKLNPSMTTLEETPSPTPEPTPEGQTPSPTPTPDPNATPVPTPDPNATPEPSTEPTATPTATVTPSPTPSPSPTVTPSPTPTPVPTPDAHAAQCKAISDVWNYKIATHDAGTIGKSEYDKKMMGMQRDAELSAAGC